MMQLKSNTIHLWQARLNQLLPRLYAYQKMLSTDEQARANRFLSDDVGQQFILSRGLLREGLSLYLDCPPASLEFGYGRHGKPHLKDNPSLQFNLSHSMDVVILGVVHNHRIGVDVEQIHYLPEMATMAREQFSQHEQHVLFSLPSEQQQTAFFTCWTRKEAYLKAIGDGFSMPLRDFDVSLRPDELPSILRVKGDDAACWELYHLEPYPGYVGAVCVEAGNHTLEMLTPG